MWPASLSNSNLATLDSQLNQAGPSQNPPGKSQSQRLQDIARTVRYTFLFSLFICQNNVFKKEVNIIII